MAWTQDKINRVYDEIQKRAVCDPDFKEKLLENPNVVIEHVSGESLPADYTFNIIENNQSFVASLALPPVISGTLSDEDLECIAGGTTCGDFQSCGTQVIK